MCREYVMNVAIGKGIDVVARRATGHLSRATCVFIRTIESQIFMLCRAILWARYLDEDKEGQQNNLYPVTHHALFLSFGTDRAPIYPQAAGS